MRSLSIALTVGALLLLPTSSMASGEDGKYRHKGCHTHKCDKRVSKRIKIHRSHPMCNTWKCTKRVDKARYARFVKHMQKTVAPLNSYLEQIARCESGGNWHIATGNGFYGGLQFTLSSWYSVGGRGMPHNASPLEQKYRAVLLSRVQGWGAWPVCSR